MENYGLTMLGNQFVQKVDTLPNWDLSRFGQLLYSQANQQCWLGGDTLDDGIDGWIPVGILERSIKKYNISWDTDLSTNDSDNISAASIPCIYGNNDPPSSIIPPGMPTEITIDVQEAIDKLLIKVIGVISGFTLEDGCIKPRHMGFKANEFLILNQNSLFTGPLATVESALNEIAARTARDWDLASNSTFGSLLGFNNITDIQSALDSLESYISTLNAVDVHATHPSTLTVTNVQSYLNSLYLSMDNIAFLDLKDTPTNYGSLNQIVSSSGSGLVWKTFNAIDILCTYPNTISSNVQAALWVIQGEISALHTGISTIHISADDVSYDNSTYTNVDDALDFLFAHAYMPSNPPHAVAVISGGIGGTSNVQQALEYLQSQVNQLIGMIPCDIWANDVHYNAPSGHTDVQGTLDYLYTTIDAMKVDISNKSDKNHTHDDKYYLKSDINSFMNCITNDLTLRHFKNTAIVKITDGISILVFGTFTTTICHNVLVTASFEVLNHLLSDYSVIVDVYKVQRFESTQSVILIATENYCFGKNDYCNRKYEIVVEDSIVGAEYDYFVQMRTNANNTFFVKDSEITISILNKNCTAFSSSGIGSTICSGVGPCNANAGETGNVGCTGGAPPTDPGYNPSGNTGGTGGTGGSVVGGTGGTGGIGDNAVYPANLQIENINVQIGLGTRSLDFILTLEIVGQGRIEGAISGQHFAYGEQVKLTAVPLSNQIFSHWGGSVSDDVNPLHIIMDDNKTLIANFSISEDLIRYILHESVIGAGTISTFPDQESYIPGTVVIVTACPGYGCEFSYWTGDLSGNNIVAEVTMNSDVYITSVFECASSETYELTIIKVGATGNDQVTPDSGPQQSNTIVNLQAILDKSSTVTWTGTTTFDTLNATIFMDADKTVTVNFIQSAVTAKLIIITNGTNINIECKGQIITTATRTTIIANLNDLIKMTATPTTGWTVEWKDVTSYSNNIGEILITGDKTITVTFTKSSQVSVLTVITIGQMGSVLCDGITITSPSTKTISTVYNTTVNLSATVPSDWIVFWKDTTTTVGNNATILMNGNKTVTATFSRDSFMLTVLVSGITSVVVTPVTGPQAKNSIVDLKANLISGLKVIWTGVDTANGENATILMDDNKTVRASIIKSSVKKAFVVAIDWYPAPNTLSGPVDSVPLFTQHVLPDLGFVSTDITILLNTKATKSAILQGLQNLVTGAKSGDILFFYYSGHGKQISSLSSNPETDSLDETLCYYTSNFDDWKTNPLRDHEVGAILKSVPEGVTVVAVLDCCHSGTGLRDVSRSSYVVETNSQGNTILISGTSDNSVSFGWDGFPGFPKHVGVLSYAIYKSLKDANYKLTYRELIDKIYVVINSESAFAVQHPQLEGKSELLNNQFMTNPADFVATSIDRNIEQLYATQISSNIDVIGDDQSVQNDGIIVTNFTSTII